MSAIAKLLHNLGYVVQGCDNTNNNNVHRLNMVGIKIMKQRTKSLYFSRFVIASSAVKKGNKSYRFMCFNKVKIISKVTIINEVIKNFFSISVTGAHGKTSTTTAVYDVMNKMRIKLQLLCGGIIKETRNNYCRGNNLTVTEADESDGTSFILSSNIKIINNIDLEHMNFFVDRKNLITIIKLYIIQKLERNVVITSGNCKNLQNNNNRYSIYRYHCIYKTRIRNYLYTENEAISVRIYNSEKVTKLKCSNNNKEKINLKKEKFRYSLLNKISTLTIYLILFKKINRTLIKNVKKINSDVQRRFARVIKTKDIECIEDYAHHPEEIRSATDVKYYEKIKFNILIFQPHRKDRFSSLKKQFKTSFFNVDILIVIRVFTPNKNRGAKESKLFVKEIQSICSNVFYAKNIKILEKYLSRCKKLDYYVTFIGAGNTKYIISSIFNRINKNMYKKIVKYASRFI